MKIKMYVTKTRKSPKFSDENITFRLNFIWEYCFYLSTILRVKSTLTLASCSVAYKPIRIVGYIGVSNRFVVNHFAYVIWKKNSSGCKNFTFRPLGTISRIKRIYVCNIVKNPYFELMLELY